MKRFWNQAVLFLLSTVATLVCALMWADSARAQDSLVTFRNRQREVGSNLDISTVDVEHSEDFFQSDWGDGSPGAINCSTTTGSFPEVR